MPRFKVGMVVTQKVYQTFIVEADDEESAITGANDMLFDEEELLDVVKEGEREILGRVDDAGIEVEYCSDCGGSIQNCICEQINGEKV